MFRVSARDGGKRAEIIIYEDVGEGMFGGFSAKRFAAELRAVGGVKEIDLRINSYGGDVFDGVTIYNSLLAHPARITTHIDGVAASIASVIAMAGDEIRIAENAWMMIHNAWGAAVGYAEDMRQKAELLDSVTTKLAEIYMARTGQSERSVRSMMDAETWIDAQTALAKGFATHITDNQRIAALAAPPGMYAFRNLPSSLQPRESEAAPPDGEDKETLRLQLQARHNKLRLAHTRAKLAAAPPNRASNATALLATRAGSLPALHSAADRRAQTD